MSTTSPTEDRAPYTPLRSLYAALKAYLPSSNNNQLVEMVDNRLDKVASGCDRVVASALDSGKKVAKMVPSPQDIQNYVITKSNQ